VPCAIGTGYGTSREERKETIMGKKVQVAIARAKKDVNPKTPHVANSDTVSWQIDKIVGTEELIVVAAANPYVTINATGKPGLDTLEVPVTYSPGKYPYEVSYSIYIQMDSASSVLVATDKLVIDTIGMPTGGEPGDHGGEPGGDGHGLYGRGHR
jgi:hypothetical protein